MNPIFKQHAMSDKANTLSKEIREEASKLFELLDAIPSCREMSLAKTKLEECVMWANKALAKEDIE